MSTAGEYSNKPLEEQIDLYGVMGNSIVNSNNGEMNTSAIAWNGKRSFDGWDGRYKELHQQHCKIGNYSFHDRDIVICEYDGRLKEFTLRKQKYKAQELICNMKLKEPENKDVKYWYPAISLKDGGDYVQILQGTEK